MFAGPRYLTSRINHELSLEMQFALWNLIDELKTLDSFEIAYLQVFDLDIVDIDGILCQKVIHRQENPDYCKSHVFRTATPIKATVFVIDDISHATMLFANEY